VLDELRSVTSADSADDFDVHTLDYLGLDDSHRPPPAATISELRNQAQAAIAGNLANPSSRLRASTVSNPYRLRSSVTGSHLSTPTADEEEEYFDNYEEAHTTYTRQRLNSYDTSTEANYLSAAYVAKGFKQTDHLSAANGLGSRPRAISVGNLDDPIRALQRRSAVAEVQHSYLNELSPQTSGLSSIGSPAGILKTDKLTGARMGSSPTVHFPNGELTGNRNSYLVTPGPQNRAISPKSDGPSSQIQTPTRSLWIGNLDSAVTSEQLIHVFAPYGAIESLRLLPEKECGFVNFVDQADAIRAKEDVLNRLGGNIGMPNGQTVRIGFGKADSAPVAPAKGSPVTSPGAISPGGLVGKPSSSANAGLGGMDAQLQSTPTRALWIGSIPSSTTPATILSVFSPYGPIESARVLTHKNCGFINFERLDDAVRARKALNGRDVLGSDVGAIRIGFAKVPVKSGQEGGQEENMNVAVQGVGDLSVGATIHALRSVKGASTIPADQQVLGGAVENYRSNLLLSMIGSGTHTAAYLPDGMAKPAGWAPSVTEQQMIMKELSAGSTDADSDIQALSEFRPPTMYYTTIPLVSERPHNRRWDASKLRELRKRLDSGTMTVEEIDQVAADFLDGEIVDLASDWLGNTVVQKLFERCSQAPRFSMLERITPHLAMIGIHKNGTWAAQKIIECVQSPDEVALIAQNLRPYAPPLLLDQFGNYVVQCCLRFGAPANDFIFDAIVDRMWEVAQGRFGARSMRACLESPHITLNQQRRIATAVILNSIPLATNPNGALLLTWLLDTSNFPSRYNLLAPRFTPHLSHLCTHKLASLTVLRIVNQKIEPDASSQVVDALFSSAGDHVLTDVLGDQVNGVAVVHKILTSPFIDPIEKGNYVEATKRVLIELKVIATQAYRRLIEEVGLPVPNFQPTYTTNVPQPGKKLAVQSSFGMPGLPSGYPSNDQGLASMMAALQMGGQNPQSGPPQLHIDPNYSQNNTRSRVTNPSTFSPSSDPFNPFALRSPEAGSPRSSGTRRSAGLPSGQTIAPYVSQSPMSQGGTILGMGQPSFNGMAPQTVPPHLYQTYMYQAYQQNPPNMGTFHT
jgi:protein JSN1